MEKLLREYANYCKSKPWHHIAFEAWAWQEYKADIEFIDGKWVRLN